MNARLPLLALLLAAAAPALAGSRSRCQGTLAGAVGGSFECQVTARSTPEGIRITVTPTAAPVGLRELGPFTVDVAGRIARRTYAGTDLAAAEATAVGADGVRWSAGREAVSLTVAKLEKEQHGSWYVGGSLAATLSAAGGRTVTVAATF